MSDILEGVEPPEREDFQRDGKGSPRVWDQTTNKMVRYRRASSSGKIMDDEYNLWDWKLRTELVGAAQRPELMAVVSTLDPDKDKRELRNIAEQCLEAGRGNARSTQGSAVHSMFDHVDLGHTWTPAPQFQAIVDAYVNTTQHYGLVPIDVEVRCVNDSHRLAGTLDRRYLTTRTLAAPDGSIIPIGSVLVGDTKTGTTLEYAAGAYSTQLAAYVDSVRYDTKTNERIPFDPPNYPSWAVIVHAVPESGICAIYWVDIEAGRLGLVLADEVRAWRGRSDLLSPAEPPGRAQEPTEPLLDAHEPTELYPNPYPGTEAVREWLRDRVQAVRNHSEVATQRLQRLWPAGVPGLKVSGHSESQLDEIADALDKVEAEHSVPFGLADPRVLISMSRHPSRPGIRIVAHPRQALIDEWLSLTGGRLVEALSEFANITPEDEWSDGDINIMLEGTLVAMGYQNLAAISEVPDSAAPYLISAAIAISSGTAMLLFDEQERPVVRFNVQTIDKQKG